MCHKLHVALCVALFTECVKRASNLDKTPSKTVEKSCKSLKNRACGAKKPRSLRSRVPKKPRSLRSRDPPPHHDPVGPHRPSTPRVYESNPKPPVLPWSGSPAAPTLRAGRSSAIHDPSKHSDRRSVRDTPTPGHYRLFSKWHVALVPGWAISIVRFGI